MLRRSNAVVLRPNAAVPQEKEDVDKIAKILATLQEIQADVVEIKEILQEICEESGEYSSGEEVVGLSDN